MAIHDKQSKKRVAVLYGGKNTEYDVSVNSARNVINNIDPELFDIVEIKINHDTNVQEIAQKLEGIDVAFPVFHGVFGEDGCIQGLLEVANIPYVGSGVLSSAVCMDKCVAKQLVQAAGILVAPFFSVKPFEWPARKNDFLKMIDEKMSYPVFVKSVNSGSSVGISKVKKPEELDAALAFSFQYDNKVIIEKGINAREIEISVLENQQYGEPPLVSLPGEIVPKNEFFDYDSKYHDPNGAEFILPVELPAQQLQELQILSRSVFDILGCESMGRVDFFLDKDSGQWYFNELNTIPGFTSMSVYPKLWEVSGLAYPQLISHLLELAMARHQRHMNIQRKVSKAI